MQALSKGISAGADQAVKDQAALTKVIRDEKPAMDSAAQAARNYNKWVQFGGRETVQQHMADLTKQEQLTRLLQRARQRGFMTPQQDYAYRQREYTQLLLWNRAEMMGYQTPEQYLTYLQKERTAFDSMTKSWRARDTAMSSALATASTYADKLGAATLTPRQLSAASKGLSNFSDALGNLPDTVSVKLSVDTVQANSAVDAFQLNLNQIPDLLNTDALFEYGSAMSKAVAWRSFLESIPKVAATRLVVDRPDFTGVASTLPALHGTVDEKVNYVKGGALPAAQLGDINKNITLLGSSSAALRNYALAAASARQNASGAALASAALAASASRAGSAAGGAAGNRGGGGGGFWGLAAALGAAGAAGGKWFGGGGWLGKIMLFGGATAISGWHLLADALIEFAAVAVPAAVAALAGLGAYAAASFTSYMDTFRHFQSQFITTAATGKDLAPFAVSNARGNKQQVSTKTTLDFVAAKVQPDVMQQLGGVLTIMKSQSGLLNSLAVTTGNVLDRFFAKVVYDFQHSGGALHTFLAVGQRDLAAFGKLASSLGSLFMEFVKATQITHVAEDLLGLLGVVVRLGVAVGHLIGPWGLAIAIGAHAAFVYGGLLVTALKNFGAAAATAARWIITLGASVSKNGVQTNALQRSWAWLKTPTGTLVGIGAIVAAFGFLIVKLDNVKDATQRTQAALVAMVAHSTIPQLLPNLGEAISKIGTMMAGLEGQFKRLPTALSSTALGIQIAAFADPMVAGLERVANAIVPFKGTLSSLGDTFSSFAHRVGGPLGAVTGAWGGFLHLIAGGAGASQTVRDLQQLQAQITRFGGDAQTVTGHLGQLAKMFGGNLVMGMGAAQAAGVTVAQMMSKNARVWGQAMTQVNDMILGFQQFGQKAGALGSDINVLTYAQSNQLKQMTALNQAWDTFTTNVAAPRDTFIKFAGDINTFNRDAKLAGAAMHGVGVNALQLQGDFQGSYSDANKMLDALRTAGVPAGVFDGVAKNLVQALLPISGHSRAAHAEIAALAQEAGGPASHNIGVLSAWAGKSVNPMLAMQAATNKATIATSNLSVDAKRTTTILQGFVNNGIAVAAAAMFNLSGKIKTYVTDLTKYGASDSRTEAAQRQLNAALTNARKVAAAAGNAVDGVTQASNKYQRALANTKTAQVQFVNQMVSGQVNSKKASSDLQKFTDTVLTNTQNTAQGKAARQQMLADLKAAGYDSSTANTMLFNYTQQINKNRTATDNAKAARQTMVSDLKDAGKWSTAAKVDMNIWTNAIENNRQKTSIAQGARQQLIKDLERTGLSARASRRLVDEYTTSLRNIPKNENTHIAVSGTGHWSVTQQARVGLQTGGPGGLGHHTGASGGLATTGGFLAQNAYGGTAGTDSIHAVLMPGEYVIKRDAVQRYGVSTFEALNAQKLAAGGVVGSMSGNPASVGKFELGEFNRTVTSMEQSVADAVRNGIQAATTAASTAAFAGHYGAGVAQWRGDVLSVLAMLGLPAGDAGVVLSQMQTESGGNPNAINLTDSNAAAGDPSRGLMQTIMTTFEAYRNRGLPNDIYNPLANIYAGVNYAIHRYGRTGFLGVLGHGHGYGAGGMVGAEHLAGGGYANPLRRAHVRRERIDMGVDYGGSGSIMAIGPGTITNTFNSGWPGGAFIGERLSSGPYAGKYVYVAEDVTPRVRRGQRVGTNTVIGSLHGQMETGWAAPPGIGDTMAARFGQQAHSGDPGSVETAFGQNYSQFLNSLGAPAGIGHGRVSGKVPAGFFRKGAGGGGGSGGGGGGHHGGGGSGGTPSSHKPVPGSAQDLAQKYDRYFAAMQTAMAAEDKAEKGLMGRPWPHGKHSGKPFRMALSTMAKRQNSVDSAWGKLTANRNAPQLMSATQWHTAIGATDTFRKWTDKGWVKVLKRQHPDAFATMHTALKAGEAAENTAYYYWNKLYGPGGIDAAHNGPPTPRPRLFTGGGHKIPVPDISALLPYSPPASYATGGLAGFGGSLMAAPSRSTYSMPRFADGGIVLPSPERGVSAAGAAAGGSSKTAGPLIGNMTINNPIAEAASGSITRGVQRAAFLAGRGDI